MLLDAFYDYEYEYGHMLEDMLGITIVGMIMLILVGLLIALVISIIFYIFESIGLYTIAKRRGIHNPWLAWLPVGNTWILGSLSDQYQYVVKRKVTNKRKILMILALVSVGLSILSSINETVALYSDPYAMDHTDFLWTTLISGILTVAGAGVSVAAVVIEYIALFDLYRSCDPANDGLYLLLSIFVGVTRPFFIFACRKKDKGMPPRREPVQPVWQPPEPVYQMPVEEPWNNQ